MGGLTPDDHLETTLLRGNRLNDRGLTISKSSSPIKQIIHKPL